MQVVLELIVLPRLGVERNDPWLKVLTPQVQQEVVRASAPNNIGIRCLVDEANLGRNEWLMRV